MLFVSCCFSRLTQQHLFSCCLPFSQVNNDSLLFYRTFSFFFSPLTLHSGRMGSPTVSRPSLQNSSNTRKYNKKHFCCI